MKGNERDYNNIIEKLEDEANASSVAVAEVMKIFIHIHKPTSNKRLIK